MPGVADEEVAVTLKDQIIRIEARAAVNLSPQSRPLHTEFVVSDYLREFAVSRGVDREKIQARLYDGVLEILLPKSQAARPKKIAIETLPR